MFYLLLAAIPVTIFVIKIDIWPFVDGKTLPEGFSRIPPDATNIKNLVSNFIPGETARYWQYEEWMAGHATLIRSVGESSLRRRINSFDAEGGFFSNCVPIPVCHSVVSYITDGEVKYVTSEEAMVKFTVEAVEFFDHYTAKDWLQPDRTWLKNWKTLAWTWIFYSK